MSRNLPYLMLVAGMAVLPYSVQRIFLATPIERTLGTNQKIFYFHVPCAWLMMLFAIICGVAAFIQLRRDSRRAEAVSIAAAEIVLVTGVAVLATGPIWGHAAWGHAWTWDARQVTTGLLWLVFAAYVLVRHYGAAGSDRLAAALAIFGAIDVPIIYYAVKIWNTMHPKTGVAGSLPSEMWNSFWPALIGLALVTFAFFLIRINQERTEAGIDDAWIELEGLGQQGGEAS